MTQKDDSPEPTTRKPRKTSHNEPSGTDRLWASLSFASVGIEMVVATLLGWAFGYYLDERFGTYPILMLIFLTLGVAAGFKGLIRAGRQAKRSSGDSNP